MYRNRAAAGVLLVALLGGLSACGDDTEGAGSSTTITIAATSYVTRQPATSTTVTGATNGETSGSRPGDVATGEQLYTVQPGDYVSLIASTYEVDIEELANYNQWPEGVNHPLQPGDVVKIPPGGRVLEDGEGVTTDPPTEVTEDPDDEPVTTDEPATTDEPEVTRTTQPPDDCSEGTYTIEEGDITRIGVAEKFDVTVQELDAANAGTPGYESFYVGLEIVIPAPSDC